MFDSLLNFRPIGGSLYNKHDNKTDTNSLKLSAYRCARPDNITREDLHLLQSKLGIRYIVDLRSHESEYNKETGMKLLDNVHPEASTLKVVDMDKIEKQKLKNVVLVDSQEIMDNTSDNAIIHFMVGLVGRNFVLYMLQDNRLPLWKRIVGFLLLIFYLLCKVPYFERFLVAEIFRGGLLSFYKSLIDYSGMSIRSALQIINQHGDKPFIICCHAGKDRTGVMAAILLSICGHDKETICDDYAMSELGFDLSHRELSEYSEGMKQAPWGVMKQLLEYVDEKYGSMEEYLVSIGFSAEEQESLKRHITSDN